MDENIFNVMNTPYADEDMEGVRQIALGHINKIREYFSIYLYDEVTLSDGKKGIVKQIIGKDVYGKRMLGVELEDKEIVIVDREKVILK